MCTLFSVRQKLRWKKRFVGASLMLQKAKKISLIAKPYVLRETVAFVAYKVKQKKQLSIEHPG